MTSHRENILNLKWLKGKYHLLTTPVKVVFYYYSVWLYIFSEEFLEYLFQEILNQKLCYCFVIWLFQQVVIGINQMTISFCQIASTHACSFSSNPSGLSLSFFSLMFD